MEIRKVIIVIPDGLTSILWKYRYQDLSDSTNTNEDIKIHYIISK